MLRGGVKSSTEKLKVSRDFSCAPAIAQCNVVDAVGMENVKPSVDGGG